MKRAVLVILILSLCVALCACGSPAPLPAPVQAADPAPTPMMEAAPEPAPEPEPEPAAPSVVELTITTENFLDYFEYVEFPENDLESFTIRDTSGKITSISFLSGYYLKDKYTVAEENYKDCKVQAGLKWTFLTFWDKKGITVDLENHSYTVTGKPTTTDYYDQMITGKAFQPTEGAPWSYYISLGLLELDNGIYTSIFTDIELVSASGTLYIYE